MGGREGRGERWWEGERAGERDGGRERDGMKEGGRDRGREKRNTISKIFGQCIYLCYLLFIPNVLIKD